MKTRNLVPILCFDFFYAPINVAKNIQSWTTAQVLDWLTEVDLQEVVPIFQREKINGVCLRELALLTKDFYALKNFLKEDFQITSLRSILQLFASLKTLL